MSNSHTAQSETRLVPFAKLREMTGRSDTFCRELIRDGEVIAYRTGRNLLIDYASIQAWISRLPRARDALGSFTERTERLNGARQRLAEATE